ncbi:MAG: replication-associated recombination protein A [Oscillospiraceae bacterium]|nr:replication-associated recombination protein A [Oscillospiraceae bacterium]
MYRPLADEIRPQTLDDVCGQKHILGSDGLLRRIIESGSIPNMIFYGPSGCGKTTVANIIAKATGRTLHRLNATTAGVADIKAVIGDVDTLMAPEGILLYLDEIQYFNKKQQQSLLEFLENGKVTMIAATTENPYFYVYNAVLSRCTVFEFKALTAEDVLPAIRRGFEFASAREQTPPVIEDGVAEYIAAACGGDVRKGLNAVEILTAAASASEGRRITLDDARIAAQKSAMRYDRAGDEHYDIISALQKSIRGSDPDAAIHYLARLVEAGDLISPCRRLQVIAAEDIGLAYPMAIPIVKACVDSAMALGYPEAAIPLADAVILLATAPKSNSGNRALEAAMADIRAGKTGQIPRHLQNRHMDSAGMEREQGYLYPHDYPDHYVKQQYLPDEIKDRKYYTFGDNKTEQAAAKYWAPIKDKEE